MHGGSLKVTGRLHLSMSSAVRISCTAARQCEALEAGCKGCCRIRKAHLGGLHQAFAGAGGQRLRQALQELQRSHCGRQPPIALQASQKQLPS